MHRSVLSLSSVIVLLSLLCLPGHTTPIGCTNDGAKSDPRVVPVIKPYFCFPPRNTSQTDQVAFSKQLHVRLEQSLGKTLVHPTQTTPQQELPPTVFEHQLEGTWTYVVGHVGFFYDFPIAGNAFVSIIGLRTTPTDNSNYVTQEWERNAFWFDVGDGVPMHLSAEYFAEFIDPENPELSVLIFNCYNLLYRQRGKDYSNTELNGEWVTMELFTDLENNVIDYNILLMDENDEVVDIRKFEPGDEVESWTSVYILDEPDSIYNTSMEEDFRTVQSEPVFMYEHMTPNVDFPNALTENLIDFSKIDLQLTLLGVDLTAEEGQSPYQFTEVKNMGLQWDGSVATRVTDWIFHWFE